MATAIPGLASGRVMRRKADQALHPSISAASYSSPGMSCNAARISNADNGAICQTCTSSMRVIVSSQFSPAGHGAAEVEAREEAVDEAGGGVEDRSEDAFDHTPDHGRMSTAMTRLRPRKGCRTTAARYPARSRAACRRRRRCRWPMLTTALSCQPHEVVEAGEPGRRVQRIDSVERLDHREDGRHQGEPDDEDHDRRNKQVGKQPGPDAAGPAKSDGGRSRRRQTRGPCRRRPRSGGAGGGHDPPASPSAVSAMFLMAASMLVEPRPRRAGWCRRRWRTSGTGGAPPSNTGWSPSASARARHRRSVCRFSVSTWTADSVTGSML